MDSFLSPAHTPASAIGMHLTDQTSASFFREISISLQAIYIEELQLGFIVYILVALEMASLLERQL